MLDPLSALGIASNVVQLVSFTADIVTESLAFVKDQGVTISSLESIAQLVELQQASYTNIRAIETTAGPSNREEQAVKDIAEKCALEARALICLLRTLAPQPGTVGKRKLGSAIVTVVKARWKRSDIEEHRQALCRYQEQLNLALVRLIRRDQSLHFAALREVVELGNDEGHRQILDAKDRILEAIDQQRCQYEVSTRDNTAQLSDLAVSQLNNRDMILMQQVQNRDDILNANTAHRQETSQLASDTAKGISQLHLDLKSIRDSLRGKEGREIADKLLASLHFRDMRLRQQTIVDAHARTFGWIFSDEDSVFKKWLSNAGEIFWVNGKAGSGKSTLMKFLASDWRTKQHLCSWARDAPLVITDFYFWHVGTELQKSEEGLLRSIIYQILHACPELIPVAAPRRWENVSNASDSWSLRELREAVERIASSENIDAISRSDSSRECLPKFCFFIDGLDEYQADHLHLVELLKRLSTKPMVKICVSSRPWNVFDRAFGNLPEQLVLEQLTRQDITVYVQDELQIDDLDGKELLELAEEIVAKAQGVFLWVYLTVRSLREGIVEGDSMSLLRERVAQLPSDLEEYFQLILSRVHPIYKKSKTMTALHMAMRGIQEEYTEMRPRAFDLSFVNFWILREGIEDPEFAIHLKPIHVDSRLCDQFARQTKTFLSAVCKDLVYLPSSGKHYTRDSEVVFLHRTVYEFLDSDEMRPQILAGLMPHVRERSFELSMALARTKFITREDDSFQTALTLVNSAIAFTAVEDCALSNSLMAEVEKRAVYSCSQLNSYEKKHPMYEWLPVLNRLLERNHYAFTTEILKTAKQTHEESNYDFLLRGALGLSTKIYTHSEFPPKFELEAVDETFIRYLLSFNVRLNSKKGYGVRTWVHFLQVCYTSVERGSTRHRKMFGNKAWKIANILIEHGADLCAELPNGCSVEEALRYVVPSELHNELSRLYEPKYKTQYH